MKKISMKKILMKQCGLNDLDNIFYIQSVMVETFKCEERNYYIPDSKEYLKQVLSDSETYGWIYGAYHNKKMIGYIYLSISPKIKELAKLVPNLKGSYADIDGVIVLPEYRGNGLQRFMFRFIEEKAIEKGILNLLAEITCENLYSLNNSIQSGFEIVNQYKKSGTINRYILYKSIREIE